MKKNWLLAMLPLLLIVSSYVALADGGFFPPVYYAEDIYEPTQKGIIIFDGSVEQLIIQATYQGEVNNFAWIIPVPSYPDINKTSTYLFEELHFLTQPNYKRAPHFFSGGVMYATESLSEVRGVTVHEQKHVGIYQVTVLSSEDSKALLNWLQTNNYRVSPEAELVLNYYIQKQWYFIAMRINLVPYDEKLITSLKNINPSISNSEDAVNVLTNDVVNHIESETKYNKLTTIRTTTLNYGEDDEKLSGDYKSRRTENKPIFLITENDYNQFYEQYNGYFENHITHEIQNNIQNTLNQEIAVPDSWQCYNRYGSDSDYSKCSVWYFTQDSEEYQLLKDVKCGKYCSLISKEKDQYTIDDLSKVGAYAVVNGDDTIKNYFGVTKEKRNWYDNDEDQFNNIKYQIQAKLTNSLEGKRIFLVHQLTNELIKKYSQQTGSAFGSSDEIATFISERTLDDFKQNKAYSSSYVYGLGLLTHQEYTLLKSLFDGDHDALTLKNNVETAVKNAVYWKQTTVQRKLGSGTVQPISIKFKTPTIIYPLKISSLNKGVSEVLLYVFAKYKVHVEGIASFETEYAKWIEADDLKTDRYYAHLDSMRSQASEKMIAPPYYWNPNTYYHLNQLLDDKYFLTKFRKEMWPKEMTDDLRIVPAENNKEYTLTVYQKGYLIIWGGFFIGLAILWGILLSMCLLPKWIHNKIIHTPKKSIFYMTLKRCVIYALVIPMIIFFSALFPHTIGRLIEEILEFFGEIFEFISHLFNYIGLPKVVNAILIFILGAAFFFLIIHIASSFIVLVYRKIKGE